VASLLSALIPGVGQVYAGDRSRGRRLIVIDLTLIVLLILGVVFFQGEVLKAWASLSSLSLIMVANLCLLTFRAWAAYDAYHLVSGPVSPAAIALASGALVVMVVLIPHIALGYLNVVQYSLISEVFAPEDGPIAGPSTSPSTTVPQLPGSSAAVGGPVLWDGLERLNVLLLGSDVGAGREDIRTDTMIVVSLDPETGDAVMVSLPRNFSGIALPPGMGMWDCDCFPQLLNDLWFVASENPDAFPGDGEPGPRAIKATIGHLLGTEVQYYAMVSLDGFVGIVDALGGVTIEVPNTIIDETYPHEDGVTIENIVIEEGTQHLDGHLALAYARIRRHADDFARMNRQRCVLGAVVAQSSPLELLASYGSIAEVLKDTLQTDIPRERLVDFIDILPKISMDRVGVLAVNRDYISGTDTGRTYYDQERIRAEAQALFADPTSGGVNQLSLDNTCD
jgi:polyisoprenyl-teichoic acid--peptidoglycan teichoic acid transferase